MFLKILPLLLLIATGAVSVALGLFDDEERAIHTLNRYALYIAFPALIIAGLADPSLMPPDGFGFYAVHVVGFLVICAIAWLTGALPNLNIQRGTIVLCTIFGNIAYFGIPFVQRVIGEQAAGLASLSAAIHVALAMVVGPFLFLVGNPTTSGSERLHPLREVATQPLVWSPVIGLASRFLPPTILEPWMDVTSTIGGSAGPVALFMLGMYIWHNRRAALAFDRSGGAILLLKLILYPAVTALTIRGLQEFLPLSSMESDVLLLMAGMPVAVTTFAITEEFQYGRDTAAGVILVSTLMSLITLPLLASL